MTLKKNLCAALALATALSSVSAYAQSHPEHQICGPAARTPNLDEVRFNPQGFRGQKCYPVGDGKYCFQRTDLYVPLPPPEADGEWLYNGHASVACVNDNEKSCRWNNLGAPDRFFVDGEIVNNAIHAYVLTNALDIGVALCVGVKWHAY